LVGLAAVGAGGDRDERRLLALVVGVGLAALRGPGGGTAVPKLLRLASGLMAMGYVSEGSLIVSALIGALGATAAFPRGRPSRRCPALGRRNLTDWAKKGKAYLKQVRLPAGLGEEDADPGRRRDLRRDGHRVDHRTMIDSGSSETVREFSPAQYIAPYLLLIIGNAGVQNTMVNDRPAVFWVFTAIAALGTVSAVVRLQRMGSTHKRRTLPAWTRFLGALLAVYGLYVVYRVIDGMAA
jgi:hypothetical protein